HRQVVHPGRGDDGARERARRDPGAYECRIRGLLSAGDHGDVHEAPAVRPGPCRRAARPPGRRRRGGVRRRVARARRSPEPAARPGEIQRDRAAGPRGDARYGPLRRRGPVQLPASIFREYGIRGIVGDQLRPEVARAIGQAVATLGWERFGRAPRLAVGRDNRPSGAALAHGVLSGIEAVGGFALDVGELPTPALYFATHVLNVDGGVQVTGSHNPPEFNGFKLVLGAEAVSGAAIQGLRRLIEDDRTPGRAGGSRGGDDTVLPRYRDAKGRSWASRSTATATASAPWTSRGGRCSATSCWCCSAAIWHAAWAPATP